MLDYEKMVAQLQLNEHPEGGYFRETYRSAESLPSAALPERYAGSRAMSTSIIYLLPAGNCSRWHRMLSDETWHFYSGVPLYLYQLTPKGFFTRHVMTGLDEDGAGLFQLTIPAGDWFGARPASASGFSLVGCTVAPGFDFNDFELVDPAELCRMFPEHTESIRELMR